MAKVWRCGVCFKPDVPRTKQVCPNCGIGRRPKPKRRPAHQMVLEVPYEVWASRFGDRCNVCGRPPGPNRKLDRDHDHKTGEPRGLLCHRCNRALPDWVTPDWLDKAKTYLLRTRQELDHDVEIASAAEEGTR